MFYELILDVEVNCINLDGVYFCHNDFFDVAYMYLDKSANMIPVEIYNKIYSSGHYAAKPGHLLCYREGDNTFWDLGLAQ